MAIQVQGGTWDGTEIKKARKPYKCEYYRGSANGGWCRKPIAVGDYYAAGEPDDIQYGRNGVILTAHWCLQCAGPEAIAAVACIGC